jgi:cytochrome P450
MTVAAASPVYFDPFDPEIKKSPHATYKRLRDEAPLFYNEQHDFYLVSRYEDVQRLLNDRKSYISAKGMTIQLIKTGAPTPPGLFVNEDPPLHTRHRSAVALLFNPGHIAQMETKIRDLCAKTFDELVGRDKFDLIHDVGAIVPTQVVGMLVGIPDEDRAKMREDVEAGLQAEYKEGEGTDYALLMTLAGVFNEYIEWRAKNPADDDLMTQLMTLEFTDETGTTRRLTRDELLMFLVMIASAGIDTTSMFTGWAGKTLSDHPDQRQILLDDPSVIPNAVEEILRFESPSYHVARYSVRPTEFHGKTVPAESCVVGLQGSANRDDRVFENPEIFDVKRQIPRTLAFGYGAHHCLGSALARLEGRIIIEEMLKRFPTWHVDDENARLTPGFMTRGYESLPIFV